MTAAGTTTVTAVREDVWDISDRDNPWPPTLLAYAEAVRAMQTKPLTDPTGWDYQAAIHGYSGATAPLPGWNSCQHSTWFFLPWHRMYVYQFERIVRSHVIAAGGPEDWVLPFWDYSNVPADSERRTLPWAFRLPTLPDGTRNPLLVTPRNVNGGVPLPDNVTTTTQALAAPFFTTIDLLNPGFGGRVTGFHHLGGPAGRLESLPHNVVHGAIGGAMANVNTAALDPIFWLHHCNIDRLWETWIVAGHENPTADTRFTNHTFDLFDASGTPVRMQVGSVLDTVQLGYTYPGLAASAAARPAPTPSGGAVPSPRIAMVGRADSELTITNNGGRSEVPLGALPPERAAASEGGPRFHLQLSEVTGEHNPSTVYGVYLNLPEGASGADREAHEVGVVSFFGIEDSTTEDGHPMEYIFDITEAVRRLRTGQDPAEIRISLLPLEGFEPEETAAADASTPVRVGTVAVLTSNV